MKKVIIDFLSKLEELKLGEGVTAYLKNKRIVVIVHDKNKTYYVEGDFYYDVVEGMRHCVLIDALVESLNGVKFKGCEVETDVDKIIESYYRKHYELTICVILTADNQVCLN